MVAGTYNGSQLRLYVDGVPVGDPVATGPNLLYGQILDKGFRVGDTTGTCRRRFTGDVDEVRVYNRALTAAELAYLAAGFHRIPPRLPIPAGPENTRRPGVYGIASPGNVLACDPGDWNPSTVTRQYLWERAPRSVERRGRRRLGADRRRRTPRATRCRPADVGSRVRCRELATAGGETSEALSFNTKRVDEGVPFNTPGPTIGPRPARVRQGADLRSGPLGGRRRGVRLQLLLVPRRRPRKSAPASATRRRRHAATRAGVVDDASTATATTSISCLVVAQQRRRRLGPARRLAPVFVIDDLPANASDADDHRHPGERAEPAQADGDVHQRRVARRLRRPSRERRAGLRLHLRVVPPATTARRSGTAIAGAAGEDVRADCGHPRPRPLVPGDGRQPARHHQAQSALKFIPLPDRQPGRRRRDRSSATATTRTTRST